MIIKRDGSKEFFDTLKIKNALNKCITTTTDYSEEDTDYFFKGIMKQINPNKEYSVEEIQNIIINTLEDMNASSVAENFERFKLYKDSLRSQVETDNELKELVEKDNTVFNSNYSHFIYKRSYSRYIPEKKRRESWSESVDRVINFYKSELKKQNKELSEEVWQELREGIYTMEVLPSMRALAMAGPPAERDNLVLYNCSATTINSLDDFAEAMYVLLCGTGLGFSVEEEFIADLPKVRRQKSLSEVPTYYIEDSAEGWADALKTGLYAWFTGNDVNFDYSFIRPAGARLKTKGGFASGPDPLKRLLEFTKSKVLSKQGRRLSSVDVHDIVCMIGLVVVSGGVRRSALISLSDLNDVEIAACKTGEFWQNNEQRFMSNNSAVYLDKPSSTRFLDEWLILAKSGSGERGLFNRAGALFSKPKRRKKYDNFLTNPCITGDTWIDTDQGKVQVKDLIDKPFNAIVDGNVYPSSSKGFFSTGNKRVYELTTMTGHSLKLTSDHKVYCLRENYDYDKGPFRKLEMVKARDIKRTDLILLNKPSIPLDIQASFNPDYNYAWLLGLLSCSKIIKGNKRQLKVLCDLNSSTIEEDIIKVLKDFDIYYEHYSVKEPFYISDGRPNNISNVLYFEIPNDSLDKLQKDVSSIEFKRAYLVGCFHNLSCMKSQTTKFEYAIEVAHENVKIIRDLLNEFNINHTIDVTKKFTRISLFDESIYKLISLGVHNGYQQIYSYKTQGSYNNLIHYSRLKSLKYVGTEEVYDCTIPSLGRFSANGILISNCAEIILRSKQLCNLTSVVCRSTDNKESLLRKIRLATILGTIQSCFTNFKYVSKEWETNCNEERLLGVSLSGQMDCPFFTEYLFNPSKPDDDIRHLKEHAVAVNKEYADLLGIPHSAAITCVKPAGTESQMTDASSGFHTRWAPYYIRRVEINHTDPLLSLIRDAGIKLHPKTGQTLENATTFVAEFYVKSPEGAVTKNDVTALQQLEYWKLLKNAWAEHSVSATIYVAENEWTEVAAWVYRNFDFITGLSFLPKNDHIYPLAPYQDITKEQYEEEAPKQPFIDFSKLIKYERSDNTTGSREFACVGDKCEL